MTGQQSGNRPPPSGDSHRVGDVCWIDLGVADTARVASFYTDLFGWEVAAADDSGYRLATQRGHLVAAFGPAEDPGAPYWTVYVRVHDAASAVAAICHAGGAVVAGPEQVGEAGIAATVQDPNGSTFALWQPLGHAGTWKANESGTLAGFQLLVDDLPAARRFWAASVSWRLADDGRIKCHARTVSVWRPAPNRQLPATPWLVQFRANDPAAARNRAIEVGATVAPDEQETVLLDPAGARFSVVT